MTAKEINDNWNILYQLISSAILRTANRAVSSCRANNNTAQEPDYVLSMVMEFTPDLYHILKIVFPYVKYSVTGIYVHQKPLAIFGASPHPEIGDILFVYRETDRRNSVRTNSLLLQAKMTSSPTLPIPASEMHQYTLYSQWPAFTYSRAGSLNGTKRDILPKMATDGAQYLLIDDDPHSGMSGYHRICPMGCATTTNPLYLNSELSVEILNLLKYKSGRTCEEKQSVTGDEWSKMIWDLVSIAQGKMTKRNNMGVGSTPRSATKSSDGMSMVMSEIPSIIGVASTVKGDTNDPLGDESGGVSVIVIESQEEEGTYDFV